MATPIEIKTTVKEKYGEAAKRAASGGLAIGCCGSPSDSGCGDPITSNLYDAAQQTGLPAEAVAASLGCGNPTALAELKAGEVVLDLGSGGGIDCFLAARRVGPTGRVIGVDMTSGMVERARALAAKEGLRHVQFRLGEIEHLPVAERSVDVILSNCVVNLSPDKAQVFREALRVLKPGGRLLVSDLVLRRPLPPGTASNVELYVGCVAGAALKDEYLALIREAGFEAVEVLDEGDYRVGCESFPEGSPEREAFEAVASVKVRAVKPLAGPAPAPAPAPDADACCGGGCC